MSESTSPTDDFSKQAEAVSLPLSANQQQEDKFTAAKKLADRANLEFGNQLYTEFQDRKYKELGFKSFDAYARHRGVEPWRAKRLRGVFGAISQLGIPIDRISEIGYDKAIAILPVLENGTKDYWLKRAAESSYDALLQEVAAKKPPRKKRTVIDSNPGDQPQYYIPEDKIKLASQLPPDTAKPSVDGKTDVTDDELVYRKSLWLVGSQNTVFETVLDYLERETGSEKPGYLITLALMWFLGNRPEKGKTDEESMKLGMDHLERRHGGRLMWVRNEKVAEELTRLIKQAEENVEQGRKD